MHFILRVVMVRVGEGGGGWIGGGEGQEVVVCELVREL